MQQERKNLLGERGEGSKNNIPDIFPKLHALDFGHYGKFCASSLKDRAKVFYNADSSGVFTSVRRKIRKVMRYEYLDGLYY
jgi:hypothetical protein